MLTLNIGGLTLWAVADVSGFENQKNISFVLLSCGKALSHLVFRLRTAVNRENETLCLSTSSRLLLIKRVNKWMRAAGWNGKTGIANLMALFLSVIVGDLDKNKHEAHLARRRSCKHFSNISNQPL